MPACAGISATCRYACSLTVTSRCATCAGPTALAPCYARDVADDQLRRRSYGYGLTKMIVLWESPFERFLYLDADTIVWGNLLAALDVKQAAFIFNEPHEQYTEHVLKGQYFDYDRLFKRTRAFRWQGLPFFDGGGSSSHSTSYRKRGIPRAAGTRSTRIRA